MRASSVFEFLLKQSETYKVACAGDSMTGLVLEGHLQVQAYMLLFCGKVP
jgi:hypothetical protein